MLLVVWLVAPGTGAPVDAVEAVEAEPTTDATPIVIESLPLPGVDAGAAAYLLSGQSGGEVLGEVIWTIGAPAADVATVQVALVVEVDGTTLLDGIAAHMVPIELYGYLLDDAGTVVEHLTQGLNFDRDLQVAVVEGAGCRFVGELEIEPGRYSMRVMVRNRLSGRFFLARQDIEVPSSSGGELSLLPPLVSPAATSWVIVTEPGLSNNSVLQSMHGLGGWPSARPVWSSDAPLEMILGSSVVTEGHTLRARLIDVTGRIIHEPEIVLGEESTSPGDLVFHRTSIAASDVPAGGYRLMVDLADNDSGRAVSQSLPVVVISDTPINAWTDLTRADTPNAPAETIPPEEVTKETVRKNTIRREYLEALALLAEGDLFSARRAVAKLEQRATAAATAKGWMQLREVEIRTAAALARTQPASVMAVTLLHRELYSWYVARRRYGLAEHSWALAVEFAEGSRKLNPWKPPEGFAEAVLLDLAAALARAGQTRAAHTSLDRVAQLAPDNPQALLGLGAIYERSGDINKAVQFFQRLVDKHPNHTEARLRLAVSRARLGSGEAAEGLLFELLGSRAPQWIHTLAYQELARVMVADKRPDRAERLLRDAIERIPHNQRLRIQLAHVLDLAERSGEATTMMEELGSFGGQLSTSPRVRYAAWPDLDLDAARKLFAEAREPAISALGKALR